MCVLKSPMSTGIVKDIRKSFFGTKTWGGAPQNLYWGGYGSPALPAPPPMLSQSAKLDKKEKKTSMQPASGKRAHEGRRKSKNPIKNVLQSNLYQRPPLHNDERSTTATLFCPGGQSIQLLLARFVTLTF